MFKKILKIFVFTCILILFISCQKDSDRKIKLSDSDQNFHSSYSNGSSTTLHISPEEQSSIAILFFENATGDSNMNWLQRGLGDMLRTELSQSPYFKILNSNRLIEVTRKENNKVDISKAILMAREAKADLILSGKYYKSTDSLVIDVNIFDTEKSIIIKTHKRQIAGLEHIFGAVNNLAYDVANSIHGGIEKKSKDRVHLAQMTESIEAFRCYSKALDFQEKFFTKDAEMCFEKAIEMDSTFAAAYMRLAFLKYGLGKREEGEKAYNYVLKYKNKLSKVDKIYLTLLEAYLEGEYEKRAEILENAVERLPFDVELRLELARYYRYERLDLERALAEFQTVIEMDPSQKRVYNDLGYLYAELGDFDIAVKYLKKYQEMAPDEPNPFDSMGEILMRAGRLEQAISQYEFVIENWPNFFNSAIMLAGLESERGNYDKALKYITHANQHVPGEQMIMKNNLIKASIYWKSGEIKNALKTVEHIEKSRPLDLFVRWYHAEIAQAAGDTLKAQKIFQEYFNYSTEKYYANPYGFENYDKYIDQALFEFIEADKILPVLNKMKKTVSDSIQSAELEFALAKLLLQKGSVSETKFYINKNEDIFFNILSDMVQADWYRTWQHFMFISDRVPETRNILERLIEAEDELHSKNQIIFARYAKASAFFADGDSESGEKLYIELGTPLESKWYVTGPFRDKSSSHFDKEFPPEKINDLNTDLTFKGKKILWEKSSDNQFDGYLNLKQSVGESHWAVAYGQLYIHSPDKRKVQLRFGSKSHYKVWLNDELVWQYYTHKRTGPDSELITVALHPGNNKLLIKSCNSYGSWGFYLRVTDEEGQGFEDIKFRSVAEIDKGLAYK